MKRLNKIFLGGVLQIIVCSTVLGQFASLSAVTSPVIEGASLDVTCTLTAMNPTSDTTCNIVIRTGSTPTVELGLDLPDVTQFSCVVPATQTMETISIPTFADSITEDPEMIDLDCSTPVTGATAMFTLTDDGNGSPAEARFTRSVYAVEEAGVTITYTVEFLDPNGNQVNAEEDFSGATLVLPNAASDTAVDMADFDLSTMMTMIEPPTAMLNIDGTAVYQYTITHAITDDGDLENLEEFSVQLSYTGSLITASSEVATVWIQDNDRPFFYVLNDCTPLRRRSRKNVNLIAFTKGSHNGDIQWWSLPFTVKDETTTPLSGGVNGIDTTLARPWKRSRTRFNEYSYFVSESIGSPTAVSYDMWTYTYVSATSNTRNLAPIEASHGPTVTVYPHPTNGCPDLSSTITIGMASVSRYAHQLRWSFIKDGASAVNAQLLRKFNGRRSIQISSCTNAGLFIISRRGRGKRGWSDFIRVILSPCAEGQAHTDPFMPDCAVAVVDQCTNGGVLDPVVGLCTCPPGFAGPTCQFAVDVGLFGQSSEYRIQDFFGGNRRGRCILYCSQVPFGCTCAAGFHGKDCCDECPRGWFGANCNSQCHCVDDVCDQYGGACANGCAPGFSGSNCQIGVV